VLTLARSVSERGELTLQRRADGALELRVNGLFAMDTAETTSERLLASAAIDAAVLNGAVEGGLRVLVGGLGLGFTVEALLADERVEHVAVAEIEPDLVRWHRSGIVPRPALASRASRIGAQNGTTLGGTAAAAEARSVLDDPRVEVVVADVRDVVTGESAAAYDLVLLDVDNGPGFLLYAANAAIYREPFLADCAAVLRRGGVAAIWSASESALLADAMEAVFEAVDVRAIPVTLNGRHTHYHLYTGQTAGARGERRAG
jgi:spermidine synthase